MSRDIEIKYIKEKRLIDASINGKPRKVLQIGPYLLPFMKSDKVTMDDFFRFYRSGRSTVHVFYTSKDENLPALVGFYASSEESI